VDPTGRIPDPTDAVALACGPGAPLCFGVKEVLEYAALYAVAQAVVNIAKNPPSPPIYVTPVSPPAKPVIFTTPKAPPQQINPLGTPAYTPDTSVNPFPVFSPSYSSNNTSFPSVVGGKCGVNMSCATDAGDRKSLEKGINSYDKQIKLHEDKIKNPEKYVDNYNSRDPRYQEGLKKHWQKEINTFKNNADKLKGELKNLKSKVNSNFSNK